MKSSKSFLYRQYFLNLRFNSNFMMDQLPNHPIYSPAVIEFVTVVAETCLLLERATEKSNAEFIDQSVKILPLLYLKTSMLQKTEADFDLVERFVTEEDYLYVKEQIEVLLGEKDSYLETFHPDMALSDTPVAAFISEDLADCYQELKDFASNYQSADVEVMEEAMAICLDTFKEHWGRKLLNALKALHHLRYSDDFGVEEQEEKPSQKLDRNNFVNFLRDEDVDEIF